MPRFATICFASLSMYHVFLLYVHVLQLLNNQLNSVLIVNKIFFKYMSSYNFLGKVGDLEFLVKFTSPLGT